jgi:hypothetical protein
MSSGSPFDLTAHSIVAVRATRVPNPTLDWLRLTLEAADGKSFEIELFFRGPVSYEAARIYQEAITEANDKIGALQLRVEAPSVVAGKCRAVVGEKS